LYSPDWNITAKSPALPVSATATLMTAPTISAQDTGWIGSPEYR
jgi:hypothetical protein